MAEALWRLQLPSLPLEDRRKVVKKCSWKRRSVQRNLLEAANNTSLDRQPPLRRMKFPSPGHQPLFNYKEMWPGEWNFIKTTYDISLDSQISLLPLGFSLQLWESRYTLILSTTSPLSCQKIISGWWLVDESMTAAVPFQNKIISCRQLSLSFLSKGPG